ncbi:hypothetical protein [Phytohabitans flavus]|uniref:HNH endonuclease n=1 Tax=Phytohabitans flavus TaxID=1076124 RepID=UPI0039E787A3
MGRCQQQPCGAAAEGLRYEPGGDLFHGAELGDRRACGLRCRQAGGEVVLPGFVKAVGELARSPGPVRVADLGDICEICQQPGEVEAHHVRTLADLGRPGPLQPQRAKAMANRRRKTLVPCASCHCHLHIGQPATPSHAVVAGAGRSGNHQIRFGGRPGGKDQPKAGTPLRGRPIGLDQPPTAGRTGLRTPPRYHAVFVQWSMTIVMSRRLARHH